ncbi:TlpA disulfide reductase family protein [uncultured Pontibacter sp.]|uniref:TlpA disulfide reductase family protein n=1 Tax=uncultured Pontibacter sp. TaxID=453356 RepID=UPI002624C970|nr:TlpA disulfide reductase family protein [uncultured Pontibacter sp.]
MKTQRQLTLLPVLALLILCLSCGEQSKGYEITGNVADLADGTKVILQNGETGETIDSAFVQQNYFQFKGKLDEAPQLLSLLFSYKNEPLYTTLFIGNEAVEVKGNISDLPKNLVVTGSEHHVYKHRLDSLTADLDISRNKYLSDMFALRANGAWNDSLQAAYWGENGHITLIDLQTSQIQNRFYSNNLESEYTLLQLVLNKAAIAPDTLRAFYNRLSPKYKDSKYSKVLATYLAHPELELKNQFYDFEAEDKSGTKVKLSELIGDKYILLDFASPGCSWCKKALPSQKQIATKFREQLKPVTFYVDKNKEEWVKHNRKEDITWASLWDKNGRHSDAYTKYRVAATPTYFLINRQGVIVGKWEGYQDKLEEEILQILHAQQLN